LTGITGEGIERDARESNPPDLLTCLKDIFFSCPVRQIVLHSRSHFSGGAAEISDPRAFSVEGATMDDMSQDCYVVFVRDQSGSVQRPETMEQVVATCRSYDEAVKAREKFRQPGRSCIIRCVSETGGGD
jgi:hypothetical protein